jgi:hypothetical protein
MLALDKYSRNDVLYKPDSILAISAFIFSFSNVSIGNLVYSYLLKIELYKPPLALFKKFVAYLLAVSFPRSKLKGPFCFLVMLFDIFCVIDG